MTRKINRIPAGEDGKTVQQQRRDRKQAKKDAWARTLASKEPPGGPIYANIEPEVWTAATPEERAELIRLARKMFVQRQKSKEIHDE